MLCLVRTKACGRCGGDISLECDIYGVFVQCIQCGATWTDKDLISAHTRATQLDKEKVRQPLAASRKR